MNARAKAASPTLMAKALALVESRRGQAGPPVEVGMRCVTDSADIAQLLQEAGEHDPFLLAAAVLQDVIQNTNITEAELVKNFGSEVAFIVAELTDNPKFSQVTRKSLRMMLLKVMSRKACLIMLAEAIISVKNLAGPFAPGSWSDEQKLDYFDGVERLTAALGKLNITLQAIATAELESARLSVRSRTTLKG